MQQTTKIAPRAYTPVVERGMVKEITPGPSPLATEVRNFGTDIEKVRTVETLRAEAKAKGLSELPKIKSAGVPQVTYKQVDEIAEKLKRKDITEREFESLNMEISVLKEVIENSPGKSLTKYMSQTTGELPEVTGKSTMKSLTGSGRIVKTSKFGMHGDDIVTELGFEDVASAQKGLDEYLTLKAQLNQISVQFSNVKKEKSLIRRGEYLMQLAKGDRRIAYRSVRDAFNLTESELAQIRQGKDIMAMTKEEFDDFIRVAEGRAGQIAQISEARIQLKGVIF